MAFLSLQMKHYCTCCWQKDLISGGVQERLLKALGAKLRKLHGITSEDSPGPVVYNHELYIL